MKADILTASVKDFFTPRYLGMSLVPFVITLILMFFALAHIAHELIGFLQSAGPAQAPDGTDSIEALKFEFLRLISEYPIISLIAGHALFQWVAGILFYVIGGGLALLLAMVVAVVVTGFFTPWIVKGIQRRHYAHVELKGHGNLFTYLLFALKTLAVFFLLFLVSLPFYFVPLVNLVAMNGPFYYLFHHMIVQDVTGEVNDRREAKRIFRATRWSLMGTTLLLFLVTLVPVVGIFLQVYIIILLAHFFLSETEELREAEALSGERLEHIAD